jgi:uncharacterized membrane protein YdbT with pleckstrin-like domain
VPFSRKLLNEGGDVVLDLHPHWEFFVRSAAALVAAIVIGVVVLTRDLPGWVDALVGALVLAALIWFGLVYAKWATTNFVVTTDRLIYRHGVPSKHGIEIPLERVHNVIFHQGVIERMLGCGDLLIESGGETGQQRFTEVKDPDRVQALIHTQVDAKMARRGGHTNGVGATGDVASQLEKLEGMLQRGTLTPSEFETQKRKLLGA